MMALHVTAQGQQLQVTGQVTDNTGLPLTGVMVKVKNTGNGTATDQDGRYSIRVAKSDVLVFSFIGMVPQEITVGSKTVINVKLLDNVAQLDELVVVGYGTQKKEPE